MCRGTHMRTEAPFTLFISQPSRVVPSIKRLPDFYSNQAVMHHLWEANFQNPFGFSSLLLLLRIPTHKSSIIVPYMKRCCMYAPLDSQHPICLGKCKCVLLSTISTACLGIVFIKDVIYSCTTSTLGLFLFHR